MACSRSERRERLDAHRWSALTLAAILLCASQPPGPYGLFNLLGLFAWLRSIASLSIRNAIVGGAYCGTLYGVLNAWWAPEALVGFGVSPWLSVVATVVGAAYVKGTELAVESAAIRCFSPKNVLARCLYAGVVVFIVESLISIGSWSVPWGLIGHAHVDNQGASQLAAVGGVPLVSAAAIVLATAFENATAMPTASGARLVFAGALVGWLTVSGLGRPIAQKMRDFDRPDQREDRIILAIQPSFSRADRWVASRQHDLLVKVLAQSTSAVDSLPAHPTLVVWPELVVTNPLDIDVHLRRGVLAAARAINAPILTSVAMSDARHESRTGVYRNVAIYIDATGEIRDTVSKSRTVPLIESARPILPIRLLANRIAAETRGPIASEGPVGHEMGGDLRVAVLLCYEALFPDVAAARRSLTTDFIANLTDHSWSNSLQLSEQLDAYSRYRAIEQRLTMLRIGHSGTPTITNAYGEHVPGLRQQGVGALAFTPTHDVPSTISERACIFLLYAAPLLVISSLRSGRQERSLVQIRPSSPNDLCDDR